MRICKYGWSEAQREKKAEYSGQRNSMGKDQRWDPVRYLKGTERNPMGLERHDHLSEGKNAKR